MSLHYVNQETAQSENVGKNTSTIMQILFFPLSCIVFFLHYVSFFEVFPDFRSN